MRHINYVLKPATIDNAKAKDKRYDLTDGGGLVLEVMPSGSKTWRFKYHLNSKREKVTIGAYPAFTIKQARDRHEALRALVERGDSPAKTKQGAGVGGRPQGGRVTRPDRPCLRAPMDTKRCCFIDRPSRASASRHDSRQEPYAVVPHVRICAGGGEQSSSLPRPFTASRDASQTPGFVKKSGASLFGSSGGRARPHACSWRHLKCNSCGIQADDSTVFQLMGTARKWPAATS